jgi:uncharacterized protein
MLSVRLTPNGGRDAIEGVEQLADGRSVLKVRVRAAPSDGEANASLVKLIAHSVGIAPSQIRLVSGITARIKRLEIKGEPDALAAAVATIANAKGR